MHKGAKLILAGPEITNCIVRDLSNHGACLRVINPADLPQEFDLSFDTGRTVRKCRVAWRRASEVGISFGSG